jgi:hypothetical protein
MLYIAQLFFPFSIKQNIFGLFKVTDPKGFEESYKILKSGYKELKKEKEYLDAISNDSIKSFISRNNHIAKLNKKKKVATN